MKRRSFVKKLLIASSMGPLAINPTFGPLGIAASSYDNESAAQANWTHIYYNKGMFIAVATNKYMTSSDGIIWTVLE